jgi:hypothetical protein
MRTSGLSTLLLFSALAGCTEPARPAATSEPRERTPAPSREPISPSRGAIEWAPAAPVVNAAPAPAANASTASSSPSGPTTSEAGEPILEREQQLAPTRVPPEWRMRGGPHWAQKKQEVPAEPKVRE